MGSDVKAGVRFGSSNVVEHCANSQQRFALPIPADFREQAVLDRIPLRGSRRVMTDGDGHLVRLAEPLVKASFENSGTAAIRSAAIGQD